MAFQSKPEIVNIEHIDIPLKNVIRRMGYPDSDYEGLNQIKDLLDKEVHKAKSLLHPKGIYRMLTVKERNSGSLHFNDIEFLIQSDKVCRMLKDSAIIIFILVTIGPDLEQEVEALFSKGEATQGFILDAIGSETADAVADKLHWEILSGLAKQKGFKVTPRFSPGYGDWSLTVQNEILKVCGGGQIGISVTPSSLMIPRKSVSAVLGFLK
jgi:cobalamin-dependent methionine synthase I